MSDIVNSDQWRCRSCDQVFERRGQRDYHHRKEHQKFATTIDHSQKPNEIERSTSNAFDCSCGSSEHNSFPECITKLSQIPVGVIAIAGRLPEFDLELYLQFPNVLPA
jgi:hypothetical protein